jgi:hypothetical protein
MPAPPLAVQIWDATAPWTPQWSAVSVRGFRLRLTGQRRSGRDPGGQTTTCPGCGTTVIVRDWYLIETYALGDDGRCSTPLPGRFAEPAGMCGPRRLPVRVTPVGTS